MTDRPRIAPLPPDERDERTRATLAEMGLDGSDMALFTTLARHPRLLRRWGALGGLLLFRGTLPGRDREVLILRTAVNTGADYEWGHHVELARGEGIGDDTILALASGDLAALDPADALLAEAADELHHDSVLSDATWARLVDRFDDQQLIELCMVVGQYHLVAFTIRSLGIQREAGYPDLGEVEA